MSAAQVFKLQRNRKLNSKIIHEKSDGSSSQKMQVYLRLTTLKSKINLVISNKEIMNLNLDGIIAINQKILAIGVRDKRTITLLNQKPNFNMGNFEKVTKIEIYNNTSNLLIEQINLYC